MERRIIKKMCCPFDHNDLDLQVFKEQNEIVEEGLFRCNKCHRYYPIVAGIPIMTPDEFRERGFELPFLQKWKDFLPEELVKQLEESKTYKISS